MFMHRRKRECMTELSLKMAKAGAVENHGSCRHTSNYKLGQINNLVKIISPRYTHLCP